MPPGDDRRYQTELTRFVESKWRVSGQSQDDFISTLMGDESSHFGNQTLSKFIRGRLAAVPVGLIEALSKTYGQPLKQLESMAITPAKTQLVRGVPLSANDEGPELRFVLGHTVWAASFLITMLNPDLGVIDSKVELASRTSEDMDLEWISQSGRSKHADPSKRPLSAPDIIAALEDHESEGGIGDIVTFGILPWEIAQERQNLQQSDGRYIRLATLMDSAAACSVIVPADSVIDHSGPAGNNMRTSGSIVRWLAEKNGARRKIILGEQGTVAGEQAHRIAELAQERTRTDRAKETDRDCPAEEVEIVWEHYPTGKLGTTDWSALAEEYPGLAAIVAWDPQATAFVQRSVEPRARRYSLVDVTGRQGGPDHVTFDLCLFVHNTSNTAAEYGPWRAAVEKAARRLFYDILPAIQRKQSSLFNLTRANRDAIEILTSYFGFAEMTPKLSSQEISRIFSNIRYSVSVDPAGMAEALNMTQPYRAE